MLSVYPNQRLDAQVYVPATDYSFSVCGDTHPPRIMLGGDDISKETLYIVAGERISLRCDLHPGTLGLPAIPIDSWEWEISGDVVSDVQVTLGSTTSPGGLFKVA